MGDLGIFKQKCYDIYPIKKKLINKTRKFLIFSEKLLKKISKEERTSNDNNKEFFETDFLFKNIRDTFPDIDCVGFTDNSNTFLADINNKNYHELIKDGYENFRYIFEQNKIIKMIKSFIFITIKSEKERDDFYNMFLEIFYDLMIDVTMIHTGANIMAYSTIAPITRNINENEATAEDELRITNEVANYRLLIQVPPVNSFPSEIYFPTAVGENQGQKQVRYDNEITNAELYKTNGLAGYTVRITFDVFNSEIYKCLLLPIIALNSILKTKYVKNKIIETIKNKYEKTSALEKKLFFITSTGGGNDANVNFIDDNIEIYARSYFVIKYFKKFIVDFNTVLIGPNPLAPISNFTIKFYSNKNKLLNAFLYESKNIENEIPLMISLINEELLKIKELPTKLLFIKILIEEINRSMVIEGAPTLDFFNQNSNTNTGDLNFIRIINEQCTKVKTDIYNNVSITNNIDLSKELILLEDNIKDKKLNHDKVTIFINYLTNGGSNLMPIKINCLYLSDLIFYCNKILYKVFRNYGVMHKKNNFNKMIENGTGLNFSFFNNYDFNKINLGPYENDDKKINFFKISKLAYNMYIMNSNTLDISNMGKNIKRVNVTEYIRSHLTANTVLDFMQISDVRLVNNNKFRWPQDALSLTYTHVGRSFSSPVSGVGGITSCNNDVIIELDCSNNYLYIYMKLSVVDLGHLYKAPDTDKKDYVCFLAYQNFFNVMSPSLRITHGGFFNRTFTEKT